MWAELLSPFFPSRCPACGKLVEFLGFCPECEQWAEIDGQWSIINKVQVQAAYIYEGSVRDCIVRFKNAGGVQAGRALARLALSVWDEFQEWEPDVVIPVGSHPARIKQRGVNPAAVVAQEVARGIGRPLLADVLIRNELFLGQKGKGALERQQAVAGAFRINRPERVAGKIVLLVDDVVTTGATVGECTRVLLEAGATDVRVWALARVM